MPLCSQIYISSNLSKNDFEVKGGGLTKVSEATVEKVKHKTSRVYFPMHVCLYRHVY